MNPTEAEKAAFLTLLEQAERGDYEAVDALRAPTVRLVAGDGQRWPVLQFAHNYLNATDRLTEILMPQRDSVW